MKTLSRSLTAVSLSLFALAVSAAPAPEDAGPAVVAHLGTTAGEDPRLHVQVQLNRSDVTDVTVELFDAEGVSVHTYALRTREDGTYRPSMSIDIAPVFAPHVDTARVTAFSISSEKREALFDTGLFKAQVNPCANQCEFTRYDCNNACFCAGCTSATYSCTGTAGNCVHNCTCTGCVGDDCNDW